MCSSDLHLAAMGIIARSVPDRLAATAQTLYGTGALGIASAMMTLASGYLYGLFGLHAFWVMAACCALALLVSRCSADFREEALQGESLS